MRTDYDNWSKFQILKLDLLMQDAPFDWYLAGGYALDEFVKYKIREHEDIDILVDIKDINKILEYFDNYQIYVARNGCLKEISIIDMSTSDSLWVAKDSKSPFFLEILFFESIDETWIYKRNKNICRSIESIYFVSNNIKILQPEIQLLYKLGSSKVRQKDIQDYEAVYPRLSTEQRNWLETNLDLKN
ncbi:nucleotidyltransferase domain-containing protein [Macrococcus capreoli]|uniref:nucleotidyltransferase domain-containing protein n=1 Tax=Macrococcus capreoli TaxID=2982690 RepID=UPI003EE51E62